MFVMSLNHEVDACCVMIGVLATVCGASVFL